jgi:hypothetical protein
MYLTTSMIMMQVVQMLLISNHTTPQFEFTYAKRKLLFSGMKVTGSNLMLCLSSELQLESPCHRWWKGGANPRRKTR